MTWITVISETYFRWHPSLVRALAMHAPVESRELIQSFASYPNSIATQKSDAEFTCSFPQFGPAGGISGQGGLGTLQQHGFARNLKWQVYL